MVDLDQGYVRQEPGMPARKVWRIDFGAVDRVVARTKTAVWLYCVVRYGSDLDRDWGGIEVRIEPPDMPLTINMDDGGPPVTRTCQEWAAERPCGLLCSTLY